MKMETVTKPGSRGQAASLETNKCARGKDGQIISVDGGAGLVELK
jgi:hypothetical protein